MYGDDADGDDKDDDDDEEIVESEERGKRSQACSVRRAFHIWAVVMSRARALVK